MRRNGEDRQSFAFMEVMTGVFVASNQGYKRRRLWRLYWGGRGVHGMGMTYTVLSG